MHLGRLVTAQQESGSNKYPTPIPNYNVETASMHLPNAESDRADHPPVPCLSK